MLVPAPAEELEQFLCNKCVTHDVRYGVLVITLMRTSTIENGWMVDLFIYFFQLCSLLDDHAGRRRIQRQVISSHSQRKVCRGHRAQSPGGTQPCRTTETHFSFSTRTSAHSAHKHVFLCSTAMRAGCPWKAPISSMTPAREWETSFCPTSWSTPLCIFPTLTWCAALPSQVSCFVMRLNLRGIVITAFLSTHQTSLPFQKWSLVDTGY